MEGSQYQEISQETKDLIGHLLLERMPSLAHIVRVTGVSALWLQKYVNRKYLEMPRQVNVTSKTSNKKGKITIQLDEMWSFVRNKSKNIG